MTTEAGLLVIGASLAGVRAVEAAREAGYAGPITLVGAEAHVAYDRPALSKEFLTDSAEIRHYRTADQLQADLDVTLRLGTRAVRLDAESRLVHTVDTEDAHEAIPYDTMIIATGAAPRALPSVTGRDGVLTLRSVDDAIAIRDSLIPGRPVVIVGAGFIGAELASSALKRGAHPVLLEAAPVPLVRAVGEVIGQALSGIHARHGVSLRCGVAVSGVIGHDTVTGVLLNDGEVLPADLVVVGIGAIPDTSWLAGSGIELAADGGILCDDTLATSLPGVWAAGDIVSWPNGVEGATVRMENWTAASEQGTRAGQNASGSAAPRPYQTIPYFWSDWYGHRIQFLGSADAEEVVFASGAPDADRFVALYRRGEVLVGVATLDEQRKVMKYRRLIGKDDSFEAAVALFPRQTAPALAAHN